MTAPFESLAFSYALKGVFVWRKLWQNKLQWNVMIWVKVVKSGQLLTVSDVSLTCAIVIISIIMTDGGLPTVHRHVHRNAIRCQQLSNQ